MHSHHGKLILLTMLLLLTLTACVSKSDTAYPVEKATDAISSCGGVVDVIDVQHIRDCATRGYAAAQALLGIRYLGGSQEIPQDYVKAAKWMQLAHEGGVVAQMLEVHPELSNLEVPVIFYSYFATIHFNGYGVPKNLVKAYAAFSLAKAYMKTETSGLMGKIEEAARTLQRRLFPETPVDTRSLPTRALVNLEQQLTKEELNRAMRLAEEWHAMHTESRKASQ